MLMKLVSGITLHVAQMQEAQAEAPLAGLDQPDQKIGDLLVLVLLIPADAIAGLAYPEGPAGAMLSLWRATAFAAISRR